MCYNSKYVGSDRMQLLYFNKLNQIDFTCEFLNLLRKKGNYYFNKNELQKILYYLYLNNEYENIFKHLDFKNRKEFLNDTLKMLQMIKFINVFDNDTIYITGDDKEKIINQNTKKELEKLVDEYIKISDISNNYCNLHLYKIDPDILLYNVVRGNNLVDNFRWDIITDGKIKNINEIPPTKFFKDNDYENVILFFNDMKHMKLVVEGSTFVLNRSIKNNEIVRNDLYINEINEEKINEISNYFENIKTKKSKIKRISL